MHRPSAVGRADIDCPAQKLDALPHAAHSISNTSANPILLKVNMGAGHGGASGRYDALKDVAFDYAYAMMQLRIKD